METTFQEIKNILKQVAISQAEFNAGMQALKISQAETDRRFQETDKLLTEKFQETDRLVKEMTKNIIGVSDSIGDAVHEYFLNSFKAHPQIGALDFDFVEGLKREKNGKTLQADIALINGDSVALIEVKHKARLDSIAQLIQQLQNFRLLCPEYKKYKLYGGIASFNINETVTKKAHEQGFMIFKRVGKILSTDLSQMRHWVNES